MIRTGRRQALRSYSLRARLGRLSDGYRPLAEHSVDPLLLASGGLVLWIAASIEEAIGWLPEDLVDQPLSAFCHPDDVAALDALVTRAANEGTHRAVVRMRAKSGVHLWVLVSLRADAERPGEAAVIGSLREIHLRVQNERASAELLEHYRELAENANDVVYQADADRMITWVSAGVQQVLGWSPDELIGLRTAELLHPDDLEPSRPVRSRAYGSEGGDRPTGDLLVRVRAKDGRYRWMSGRPRRLLDDHGQLAGVVVGMRDVDELVRSREEQKRSAQRLRMTLDTMMDPCVVVRAMRDAAGTITGTCVEDVNPAACSALGRTRESLVEADLLASLPGTVAADIEVLLREALDTCTPVVRDEFAAGSRFFDVRLVPLNELVNCVFRDVTERRAAVQAVADSAQRLQMVIDTMFDAHVTLQAIRDQEGRVVDFTYLDANYAAARLMSREVDDIIGTTVLTMWPGHRDSALFDFYVSALVSQQPVVLDSYPIPEDVIPGGVHYDLRVVPLGDILNYSFRDVSERHAAAERLADSEEMYRLLAENISDVIARTRGPEIIWMTPSVTAALGGAPEEWAGVRLPDVIHPEDLTAYQEAIGDADGSRVASVRARIRSTSGPYHWVDIRTKPFIAADGRPDGGIATMRIVDAEVAAEARLHRMAHFDTLTGLVNRSEALRRLEAAGARRRTPGGDVAVLFCDIDRFKEVNDERGHAAGDRVLTEVARRIEECVRHQDLVARLGGDELLVLLEGVHSLAEATAVATKIRRAAAEPIPFDGSMLGCTLSIGVTLAYPGEDVDSLIARADRAMYAAKRNGRDQVVAIGTE